MNTFSVSSWTVPVGSWVAKPQLVGPVILHLKETESGRVFCCEPWSSFHQASALCEMPDYCFGRSLLAFKFPDLFTVQQLFSLRVLLGFAVVPTHRTSGSFPRISGASSTSRPVVKLCRFVQGNILI